jgi:urease accessory protein
LVIGFVGDQPAEERGKARWSDLVWSPALSRSCEGRLADPVRTPADAHPSQARRGPDASMTFSLSSGPTPQRWLGAASLAGLALFALALGAMPAEAHHLMDLTALPPSPLTGFLSGLAHPILGPDHLLFLCALSLVGLQRRAPWMLALLATGLLGSLAGLLRPGLPFAEAAVAFSLVVVGLVWVRQWPKGLLLPAFALHGYVLSDAVVGWNQAPVAFYGLGLFLSQGALLLVALTPLRALVDRLSPQGRSLLCAGLIGCGLAWTWSALVA